MQFRVEPATACAVGGRYRLVEEGDAAVRVAGASFGLGQRNLQ
jgi:hypothetical protein